MAQKNMKVVRLIEPDLCAECRFAHSAQVRLSDGSLQKMIHCRRLDCDNWDYGTAEKAISVERIDEAA
jgi:hypothetical protein